MRLTQNRGERHRPMQIPNIMLVLAGISMQPQIELTAMEGAVLATPADMNAYQMANLISDLHNTAIELSVTLAKACGMCVEDCECCADFEEAEEVHIPLEICSKLGIPMQCRLVAHTDEDGNITVMESNSEHLLADIPDSVIEMFAECGLCLSHLKELLASGDAITKEEDDTCLKS